MEYGAWETTRVNDEKFPPENSWNGYFHRVRYSEVDPQSIVFNSRYLEYFDAAMTEYYRELGFPPKEIPGIGFDPVVVKAEIHYKNSAVMDDILRITVECSRLGSSSLDLRFTVVRESDQEIMATAVITYVNIDMTTRTSVPVPEVVRNAMPQPQ